MCAPENPRSLICFSLSLCFSLVGEEDELSIKFAAEAVVEALGFEGDVIVSFHT